MVGLLVLLWTILCSLQGSATASMLASRYHLYHDHGHGHEICSIDEESFAYEYSSIVEDMNITDPHTMQSCSLFTSKHSQDVSYTSFMAGEDDDWCQTLFNFSQRLLVGLNTTSQCCLLNSSPCEHNDTNVEPISKAKAYGVGTVMVVALSLLSLLGVIIVPLAKRTNQCGRVYEYVSLFLVALGASALFSDALLHLIPEVFEEVLEEQLEAEGAGEFGEEEEKALALAILWRACAVVGGLYIFYLFELILNAALTDGSTPQKGEESEESKQGLIVKESGSSVEEEEESKQGLIIKESGSSVEEEEEAQVKYNTFHNKYRSVKKSCKCDVKPLAVLIIVGDAFHNFTDGLALGASISQSLGLGISTAVALAFHEIPHELGDYAILLSTGMSWYVALLFNFLSSLTALVGFFIGVSVGLASEHANGWMLAFAAGTFLYISLVDLLPLLRNSKPKGFLAMLLVNFGFFLSFIILFLVAIYEDEFNNLVEV